MAGWTGEDFQKLQMQISEHVGSLETGDLRHYFKWFVKKKQFTLTLFKELALILHKSAKQREMQREIHRKLDTAGLYDADWIDVKSGRRDIDVNPGREAGVRRSARLAGKPVTTNRPRVAPRQRRSVGTTSAAANAGQAVQNSNDSSPGGGLSELQ